MKYKYSLRAKKDLRAISKYYTQEAGEKVSGKILESIFYSVNLLCTHPNLGHVEPELATFPQCFRTLVQTPNYKIVYWLDENLIKIATVFDCRQRPEELYYLISTRTDWVCEPPVEYRRTPPP